MVVMPWRYAIFAWILILKPSNPFHSCKDFCFYSFCEAFFLWFCSPRGRRTTTSIVRGSRRGDGHIAVRAAAGGSQREFGVETSQGEKKSGAAASGGARDDITSETSTKSFSLDLSAGTHSTGRNPISKQFKLHRKSPCEETVIWKIC